MLNPKLIVIDFIREKKLFSLEDVCAVLKEHNCSGWLSPDTNLKEYLEEYVEQDVLSYNSHTKQYRLA